MLVPRWGSRRQGEGRDERSDPTIIAGRALHIACLAHTEHSSQPPHPHLGPSIPKLQDPITQILDSSSHTSSPTVMHTLNPLPPPPLRPP